eukprot:TRINITY_DN47893_c0_g3_i1.p2 TRINITY_DN47893_c0_g3~~TRINITY_DN47893_c0_g3_i1.p2  ORF type:complete len:297 (-),score=98.92 TRINITY_DN47893_c0_g3_i1:409-1299(-)
MRLSLHGRQGRSRAKLLPLCLLSAATALVLFVCSPVAWSGPLRCTSAPRLRGGRRGLTALSASRIENALENSFAERLQKKLDAENPPQQADVAPAPPPAEVASPPPAAPPAAPVETPLVSLNSEKGLERVSDTDIAQISGSPLDLDSGDMVEVAPGPFDFVTRWMMSWDTQTNELVETSMFGTAAVLTLLSLFFNGKAFIEKKMKEDEEKKENIKAALGADKEFRDLVAEERRLIMEEGDDLKDEFDEETAEKKLKERKKRMKTRAIRAKKMKKGALSEVMEIDEEEAANLPPGAR